MAKLKIFSYLCITFLLLVFVSNVVSQPLVAKYKFNRTLDGSSDKENWNQMCTLLTTVVPASDIIEIQVWFQIEQNRKGRIQTVRITDVGNRNTDVVVRTDPRIPSEFLQIVNEAIDPELSQNSPTVPLPATGQPLSSHPTFVNADESLIETSGGALQKGDMNYEFSRSFNSALFDSAVTVLKKYVTNGNHPSFEEGSRIKSMRASIGKANGKTRLYQVVLIYDKEAEKLYDQEDAFSHFDVYDAWYAKSKKDQIIKLLLNNGGIADGEVIPSSMALPDSINLGFQFKNDYTSYKLGSFAIQLKGGAGFDNTRRVLNPGSNDFRDLQAYFAKNGVNQIGQFILKDVRLNENQTVQSASFSVNYVLQGNTSSNLTHSEKYVLSPVNGLQGSVQVSNGSESFITANTFDIPGPSLPKYLDLLNGKKVWDLVFQGNNWISIDSNEGLALNERAFFMLDKRVSLDHLGFEINPGLFNLQLGLKLGQEELNFPSVWSGSIGIWGVMDMNKNNVPILSKESGLGLLDEIGFTVRPYWYHFHNAINRVESVMPRSGMDIEKNRRIGIGNVELGFTRYFETFSFFKDFGNDIKVSYLTQLPIKYQDERTGFYQEKDAGTVVQDISTYDYIESYNGFDVKFIGHQNSAVNVWLQNNLRTELKSFGFAFYNVKEIVDNLVKEPRFYSTNEDAETQNLFFMEAAFKITSIDLRIRQCIGSRSSTFINTELPIPFIKNVNLEVKTGMYYGDDFAYSRVISVGPVFYFK